MRAERLNLLAAGVCGWVVCQLNAEPGWSGEDAGRVAAAVQRVFEAAVRAIDPGPERPLPCGPGEFCEFCGAGPECVVCGRGRP